jgi:hypothetical protein
MQIGNHFTQKELTVTQTNLINRPNPTQLVNLTRLTAIILDPLREATGQPLYINSALRTIFVNRAVGGEEDSYHLFGLAADVRSDAFSPEALCWIVKDLDLPFDKMITEDRNGVCWLHIQIAKLGDVPRKEVWTGTMKNGSMKYRKVKPTERRT